jgi:hypothetical protein
MNPTQLVPVLLAIVPTLLLANVRPEPLWHRVEFANQPPPGGDLRGETVYVMVGQTESRVEAVFDVSDFSADADSVLLPIFAHTDEEPKAVIDRANIRASLNGRRLHDVTLADTPGGSPALPVELKLIWAKIYVGTAFHLRTRDSKSLNLRVSYLQPHIDRKFYYLPQSIPVLADAHLGHHWRYPLIARAQDRRLVFEAGSCTSEQLGDALIVYLRADQIVAMEAR